MSEQVLSPAARERFQQPRNYGPLDTWDGHARIIGPCGDTMEFWLKIRQQRIVQASFITSGCGPSRAAGSMATELATGRPVDEALQIGQANVLEALGGLPKESEHCALLATNTLQAAIRQWQAIQQTAKRPDESFSCPLPLLQQQNHPGCFVCGSANGHGLALEFRAGKDGAVEASFSCLPGFAGYPGMLHGGVICALLDGAMTNCLFARGLAAVTVDMSVRFRRPVVVSLPGTVRAWIQAEDPSIFRLAAELVQDGQIAATATARFLEKRAMSWFA